MKAHLTIPDRASRPLPIERAMIALVKAQLRPIPGERHEAALESVRGDKLATEIVTRAGAPVGTTGDSGFAAELTQNLVGEFLSTLAPLSAAARLFAQGLQIPLNRATEMKLPAREGAPSTSVTWVGEADPAPVRQYVVNSDYELSPRKFGFIVGVSREVAKRSGGEAVIRTLIREDAAATLDGAYFSAAAGDTATHAGMLDGVDPIAGYAGGDRVAMETDLNALVDAVGPGGSGQVAFIVAPQRALRIKIIAPLLDFQFLPSLAVAADTIVAVDPLSWAHGFGDDFDIEASTAAAIHMDTEPAEIVNSTGPTTAAPVRSFWQTDSLALRLLADVAFAPRRPNAVAWATGVTW